MMIFHNPQDLLNFNHDNVCWMMNINQEQKWNDAKHFPSVTDQQQLDLILQQEQQLLLLAKSHEKVILSHRPDDQFLSYLKEQGFELPELVINKSGNLENHHVLKEALLIPYIQSEETESLRDKVPSLKVFGGGFEFSKQLNNKYFVRRLMQSHGVQVTRGMFCKNISELEAAYLTLKAEGFKKCVIKIPYGSSGKGLYIIKDEKSFQNILSFITRRAKSFELLIEGWHQIDVSINSQLLIRENGIDLMAITEQIIDDQGVYKGTNFSIQIQEDILKKYRNQIINIGGVLKKIGYTGIVGIDSIIDIHGNIYPVIEINARFTQVTYLLSFVIQLNNKYDFIESRYIDFVTEKELSFNKIKQQLECVIQPSLNKTYFIYTFCTGTNFNNYRYRIFILFVTNNPGDMQNMLETFEGIHVLNSARPNNYNDGDINEY